MVVSGQWRDIQRRCGRGDLLRGADWGREAQTGGMIGMIVSIPLYLLNSGEGWLEESWTWLS